MQVFDPFDRPNPVDGSEILQQTWMINCFFFGISET